MTDPISKPIIFLAFANDKQGASEGYLASLTAERNGIRDALRDAEDKDWCEVIVEPDVTINRIFDIFQRKDYRDRIAVFHFAGHAGSYELLLESHQGESVVANSEGLVPFLGRQNGLQLVFLNGCNSKQQALDLEKAGVPSVIGTSQPINDGQAMNLAIRFYKGLAAGNSFERSWADGIDQLKTEKKRGNNRGIVLHSLRDTISWDVYYGEDPELSKRWNLPDAANDPLFGLELPRAYYRSLPPLPFPGQRPYQLSEAALFFGRAREIRDLSTKLKSSQPIILLSGKAGVGKTSLLQAGFAPRVAKEFEVCFAELSRQSPVDSLLSALQEVGERYQLPPLQSTDQERLQTQLAELDRNLTDNSSEYIRQVLEREKKQLLARSGQSLSILEYYRKIEEVSQRPLILVFDQFEKLFSDAGNPATSGIEDLLHVLADLFLQKEEYLPRGKVIVSCREVFHLPVLEQLQAKKIPCVEFFLAPLGREGVYQVVEGIVRHPSLAQRYRLQVDQDINKNLPGIIADELPEGQYSPVAPMLQAILSKLWKVAIKQNAKVPRFTVVEYRILEEEGELMMEFFRRHLDELKSRQEHAITSGLVLDVLYQHITPLGTAKRLSADQLTALYGDRQQEVDTLVSYFKDAYLLTPVEAGGTRLAHNLLAPMTVEAYSISVRPGQQAVRILNSKIDEFRPQENQYTWLNDADLETVEAGKSGMRRLTQLEEQLLEYSRAQKAKRERDRLRNKRIRQILAVVILVFALLAGWQWRVSQLNYLKARSNQLAFIANEVFKEDNTKALYIAERAYGLMASNPPQLSTQTLTDIFHSGGAQLFYSAAFPHEEQTVNSAVFSPDGSLVLTASEDGKAKLWELDGQLIQPFPHTNEVHEAVFSPNGKQILTLSDARKTVRLWSLDGQLIDSVQNENDTLFVGLSQYSTDGTRILTSFSGQEVAPISVWLDSLRKEKFQRVIISPDQQTALHLAPDLSAHLFTSSGDTIKSSLASTVVHGSFSADGKKIITVAHVDGQRSNMQIWSPQGDLLFSFVYPHLVERAVFSPDGKQVLTAGKDYSAKRWNLTETVKHRLPRHGGAVHTASFSSDGRYFLTASFDGLVRVWHANGNIKDSLKLAGQVESAVFSPDSKFVFAASSSEPPVLWNLETSTRTNLPVEGPGNHNQVLFSPDGSRMLAYAKDGFDLNIWTADGLHSGLFLQLQEITDVVFSPDGSHLLTASPYQNMATLWNIDGDSIALEHPNRGEFYNFRAYFSTDGNKIITCSEDSTANVWTIRGDTAAIQLTLKHDEAVEIARFAPNGDFIVTAAGNLINIWDNKGKLLDSFSQDAAVKTIHFSPDGQQVLTILTNRMVNLWDINGNLQASFEGHNIDLTSASFSPDSRRIVTTDNDGYAMLWWTPKAIYEWLKTANLYQLSPEEIELYEIAE